jgi:spermidine/putrescine transport system substrate-binding protein
MEYAFVARAIGGEVLKRRTFLRVAVGLGLSGCSTDGTLRRQVASCLTGRPTVDRSSPNAGSRHLSMFTWATYNAPEVVSNAESAIGLAEPIVIDSYASNEQMISAISKTRNAQGYDLVVPTGSYVPRMVNDDLLLELDHGLIPNFANLDPFVLDQPWDPCNRYTIQISSRLGRILFRQA